MASAQTPAGKIHREKPVKKKMKKRRRTQRGPCPQPEVPEMLRRAYEWRKRPRFLPSGPSARKDKNRRRKKKKEVLFFLLM